MRSYDTDHCWQFEVRTRNLEIDLDAAGISREEMAALRVTDFRFDFVPKENKEKCAEVARFIERHEWLGKMPRRPTHRFTATYKGHLAGVVVMATPNSFSNLLGAENRHLEKLISRGACISWSPKNLGSSLVMFSVRWMAQHSEFRVFTAYSDVEARELGTIYQACNFHYLGQTSGAREEYLDPEMPQKGWFSDRQFRKTSQIRRYAKELGLPWQPHWSDRDKMHWEKIPTRLMELLKAHGKRHQERCERRSLPFKHKYVYLLGPNKKETSRLRALFREKHSDLSGLPYPKWRGPQNNAAAKIPDTAGISLTENAENCRPQIEGPYLTVKEAAAYLRLSEWTVYNLIRSDRSFPGLNIGLRKKFVVEREKLETWMTKRTRKLFLNERSLLTGDELLTKGVRRA